MDKKTIVPRENKPSITIICRVEFRLPLNSSQIEISERIRSVRIYISIIHHQRKRPLLRYITLICIIGKNILFKPLLDILLLCLLSNCLNRW